tara:strand:- start:688 stop:912 length:225 start_codon:yes stop_codon:yes gene_type:complete
MAKLNFNEINKMSDKERTEKTKELKLEIAKANVTANKASSDTKELKRALARLHTMEKSKGNKLNKSDKEELKKT